MENCKKCKRSVEGNYCSFCGTPTHIDRIDKKLIFQEFQQYILNYEKGFLYTLKELCLNPGRILRKCINGERMNFYKPLGFLIISSGFFALLEQNFGYHPSQTAKTAQNALNTFMREHLIYFSLFQIFITSFVLRYIFLRKATYNIYEYIIVLTYSSGMTILFSSIGIIVAKFNQFEKIQSITSIIGFFYGIWLLGQFIDMNNYIGYIKAAAAKILSFALFVIITSIIFTIYYHYNLGY